jgi:hypothetical protein
MNIDEYQVVFINVVFSSKPLLEGTLCPAQSLREATLAAIIIHK